MTSAPSISVECVNLCRLPKGSGGGESSSGRYECSVLSCAWKAPRVLTGFLASTPQLQCVLALHDRGTGRRRCLTRAKSHGWIYEELSAAEWNSMEAVRACPQGRLSKSSSLFHDAHKDWKLCCSSFSPGCPDATSPETLWEDLKPTVEYLPPAELKLVSNALKLAFEAHDGQKRRSGEPFIIHPVEVARILGELELDWESIAAGLLHDTVEDTIVVTFERIEKEFGSTVRRIVEGETKVSKLGKLQCKGSNDSVQDVKADDLRQMFLAMTEEVRVIIVKLADRLHNMRTLSHMPPHKQTSIALETLQVFAPLAKLLGMYQIKSELENLSFMYTNPEKYAEVKKRIGDLSKENEKELAEAKKMVVEKIEKDQFLELMAQTTEVRSVCKEPYSIYKSAVKSKISISDVNQIAQLRIIIKPKPCLGVEPLCGTQQMCYHVLGLVHGIWTPIPRHMKDYIATPKPNGYQSLHTTVIPFLYESMFHVEVQIRTEEMDLIAERGIAAHYSGRGTVTGLLQHGTATSRNPQGKSACLNDANIALRIGWLNAIREWQEEFVGNMSSREFVDTIKRDLLGSRVFVFTPKGEIKNLPKGATVIDYAYLIHTEIGNKMVDAKVNGNVVSPTYVLANAEVVEIITDNSLSSKTAFQRHQQWLQHAKTRSARHKITKFLREQAALSANEITADAVNNFVADIEDESDSELVFPGSSKERKSISKEIIMNAAPFSSTKKINEDKLHIKKRTSIPNINGKHNKKVQQMSLKVNGELLTQGNGIADVIHANIHLYEEVFPILESWKSGKITSWHSLEGCSVQWLCVACVDRKGIIAEVTSVLTDVGITIYSCVAETDQSKRVGVMLFHVEGSYESLVNACAGADKVLGVLGWSIGCSWPNSVENGHLLKS